MKTTPSMLIRMRFPLAAFAAILVACVAAFLVAGADALAAVNFLAGNHLAGGGLLAASLATVPAVVAPEDVKKAVEEMGRTAANSLKELQEKIAADLKAHGEKSAEAIERAEKINARLDELEAAASAPGAGSKSAGGGDATHKAALVKLMRRGDSGLSADELKALSTDDDTSGGYRVPVTISNRVLENIVEISPIRELATVETITTGDTLELPVDAEELVVGKGAERKAPTQTGTGNPFGLLRIETHEQVAMPAATQKLLEDASFDVEGWIDRKVRRRFGKAEGRAFVVGSGVDEPQGIITVAIAGGIKSFKSGAAAGLGNGDALVRMSHDLEDEYAVNGTWLMHRKALGEIRLMKDSQGRSLWQPMLADGTPAQILSRPYRTAVDMSAPTDAGVFTGDDHAVLFGDFEEGYTIVDRLGMTLLRDPYTNKPFVLFYFRRRVGGKVTKKAAFRTLKIAA